MLFFLFFFLGGGDEGRGQKSKFGLFEFFLLGVLESLLLVLILNRISKRNESCDKLDIFLHTR